MRLLDDPLLAEMHCAHHQQPQVANDVCRQSGIINVISLQHPHYNSRPRFNCGMLARRFGYVLKHLSLLQ
jgi:hypothetical protein